MIRIAIDAVGGDHAPRRIVDGALAAARRFGFGLTLVGPAELVTRELERHKDAGALEIRLIDTPEFVEMAETPGSTLRRKPRASIKLAAEEVAAGRAAALFSAGSTGATVLASHGAFGMLPGVDRPALATTIPTAGLPAVLVDAGANVECRPAHLVQFAAMGTVYARFVLGRERPRVALLSIGEEATKGNDLTRDAHRLLKDSGLNFIGNIEARVVYAGQADVIVCDGFTGNVVLKISEGLVDMVGSLSREEMSQVPGQAEQMLSRRAFRRFRKRVDYSEYGGAPLLGVAGLCIVGHGSSSVKAVRNAVAMAHRFATHGFIQRIQHEIAAATPST
jgi:phosphate acyltransferase